MKIIRGRKALVTGAASGIGRAIALALAREGADLCLLDIDAAKLAATADEARDCGVVAVTTIVCDLTDPAQLGAAVRSVLSAGVLHILVNNAGVAHYGKTHEMSDAAWDAIMALNLAAPIRLVRGLLPTLLQQEEAHVVNVCSLFGLMPYRKGAAYQASKHGLVGFSRALRAEYCHEGFGVTALCPGFVRTSMLKTYSVDASGGRYEIPDWLCVSAETVAAKTIGAIRRNKGVVLVSATDRMLWWFTRMAPRFSDWVVREGWRRRGRPHIGLQSPK